jgi:hypothetical protein
MSTAVMPDLIRHPVNAWIPNFAGMTIGVVFNYRSNKTLILAKALFHYFYHTSINFFAFIPYSASG